MNLSQKDLYDLRCAILSTFSANTADLLIKDLHFFYDVLSRKLEFFETLDGPRKVTVIQIAMYGLNNFFKLKRMIKLLTIKEYEKASRALLECQYSKTVQRKLRILARQLIYGKVFHGYKQII